jgi:hypothetical protein
MYNEEYAAIIASGFNTSLFSYEEFTSGTFRTWPPIESAETIIYRGWMVTLVQYRELAAEISRLGAAMLTSPVQYERCHYLPGWYGALAQFTPETHIFRESDDIVSRLKSLSWSGCFLKDYVKSLANKDGSFITDLNRVPEIIAKMKKYRGQIEGGVCARRLEEFDHETEERYFVYRGTAYSRNDSMPEAVGIAANRIDSPFFTVDTIRRRDGVIRIVELGDGQVSDRKKWTAPQLTAIFREKNASESATKGNYSVN